MFFVCIGIFVFWILIGVKSFWFFICVRCNVINKWYCFIMCEVCVLRCVMIKFLKGMWFDNKWENIVVMCVDDID